MNSFEKLSIVIITKNEEENLPRCLNSLPKGAEIIVVDSGSQDRTKDIARSFGCDVYDHPFSNFADQKNFAVSKATRPWVLSMDADEELSLDSVEPLARAIQQSQVIGFRLTRHLVFMGREMRFGKTKDAPLRLFLKDKGQYQGDIHEEVYLSGTVARTLKGVCIYHYSYQDLSDYFNRFNRYTSAIAVNHRQRGRRVPVLSHLMRPWLEFISRYFFRLGFLDGYPGYTYALISSLYAYVKYAKLKELGDFSE